MHKHRHQGQFPTSHGESVPHEIQMRAAALKYLVENISTKYKNFNVFDFGQTAFIPATTDGRSHLASPEEVRLMNSARSSF
jgi:hypothetical protein